MNEDDGKLQGYARYIGALFAQEDDALRSTREQSLREKLPEIQVSVSEGKLLYTLALLSGASRVLEIGTLGGYSAIWLARALPADGKLISLEIDRHHAEVARRNLERAALAQKVEVRIGPALDTLMRMQADHEALFDLVFIDADKDAYVAYLDQALPLLRPGGLLLADNTLPDAVLDPADHGHTKPYNAAVSAHPDLVSIIIPVLRARGLDGLTVSVKRRSRATPQDPAP